MRTTAIAVASLSITFALAAGCGGEEEAQESPLAKLSCTTDTGPCSQAEVNQYGACIADRCDAAYQACFGATYRTGSFSGPCGTYYNCLGRCGCNDSACRVACGVAPTTCQVCIANKIATCANSSACQRPSCSGPAPPGGNTCADLLRCCQSITDKFTRDLCVLEYNEARKHGDYICGPFVQGYRQTGMCK